MAYLLIWRHVTNADFIWTAQDKQGNSLRPADWPQRKQVVDPFGHPGSDSLRNGHFIPDQKFWPLQYRQGGRHKKMPDLSSVDETSTLVVNQKARDLIEELEADVHTFVPMTVELVSGEIVEGEYWLFRNGNWLKGGLIPEKSEVGVRESKKKPWIVNTVPSRYWLKTPWPTLVWRKEIIAGKHLWVDPKLKHELCISCELAERFKANKIKHFELVEGGAE